MGRAVHRSRRWFPLVLLVGWAGFAPARAASPFTETFTTNLAGWTNGGTRLWSSSNNTAVVTLPVLIGPIETAILKTTPLASGGAFTGDYVAVGISLMGFAFKAETYLPDRLQVQWKGDTNSVFLDAKSAILATGVWYYLAFSLASASEGGWVSGVGENTFVSMQTNVNSISVQVEGQSLATTARYRLDDFFIDRGHLAGRLQPTTNGYGEVTWNYVRSNYTYRLEYADTLTGSWTTGAVVTATSTTLVSSVSLTNVPTRCFRLQQTH